MGIAKENEDESEHSSGTVGAMEHASSSYPAPAGQDASVPSENSNPSYHTDVSPNGRNNVVLNSTSPQSDCKAPSSGNRLELESSPQLSQTGEALCEKKETNPQQYQIEAAPDSNRAELKMNAHTAQTEIVLNDNIEGLTVDFNTGPLQQPLNTAASRDNNVDLEGRPQTKTAAYDKDVNSMSTSRNPQTVAAANGKNVELKSGSQQPPHAPSDEKKSLPKPETEPLTDENTKCNERADCKPETCGEPTGSTEIAKLTTASKSEPFQLLQNQSDHQAGTFPKQHKEPAMPHVESASIKIELEDKKELKNENNGMNILALNSNGNSSSNNSFLLESYDDVSDSGSEEERQEFMKELENFFRVRRMEFKPPKFYGEGLNCLKLWRSVMRLGGYDKVTSCKLWRQVGESFKPPKTCTTVSWTFRGFYEKALLDYERHKTSGGELSLPPTTTLEPMSVDNQTPGLGRARRDAAARAMQGWQSRLLGNAEVSDAIIKDKNSLPLQKHEKQLKSVGLLKRKKPSYMEQVVKAAREKLSKPPVDVEVVDLGPPAEWVKINVQKTKDCFEVYALVPGLLREEVRVQSDPAGRLVISGEPEHPDNPWGVTPFKKAVNLSSRIDPHQTSAVVTLHGQLFVRVPFEQSN